jgi:hypothetical protein
MKGRCTIAGCKWICSGLETYALPYCGTGPVQFCMSPVLLAILSPSRSNIQPTQYNMLEMLLSGVIVKPIYE